MRSWHVPATAPMFAHQGGWDELLLVAGPLILIGGALWLANKRVSDQLDDDTKPAGKTGGRKP